jgi:hypothetical protein
MRSQALSPPLRGGDGRDDKIKCREATVMERDGVVIKFRQDFVVAEHHPVCAS